MAEAGAAVSPELTPEILPTPSEPARLSRREWLKREYEHEQHQHRIEKHRQQRPAARSMPMAAEWSAERERKLVQERARVRPLIDGPVSRAREYWRQLCANPATSHLATGIKRVCDANGWTLADLSARRALVILEFLRGNAIPSCWNAKYTRAPARGMGKLGDALTRSGRKYAPCARAIAQPFLATVIAWPGDCAADSRPTCTKTVARLVTELELAGLIQAVQVPNYAAEPHEIGETGHVINRYWLADRGSPKPALMSVWRDADGGLLTLEQLEERARVTLEAPWSAARPQPPP
jgi:hypothetical protein